MIIDHEPTIKAGGQEQTFPSSCLSVWVAFGDLQTKALRLKDWRASVTFPLMISSSNSK